MKPFFTYGLGFFAAATAVIGWLIWLSSPDLTARPSAPPEPWYVLPALTQRCQVATPEQQPMAMLRNFATLGIRTTMHDTTAWGAVVETTMTVEDHPLYGGGYTITWYRGAARCEAVWTAWQQEQTRQQQVLDRKYR